MAVVGEEVLRVETLGGPVQIVVGKLERGQRKPASNQEAERARAEAERDQAQALAAVLSALAVGSPGAELAIEEALGRVASLRVPHASREELGPGRTEHLGAEFIEALASGFLDIVPPQPVPSLDHLELAIPVDLGPLKQASDPVEQSFISFTLKDQDGAPVPGRRFRVELPDGSVREGVTSASGFGGISNLSRDGTATITFLDLDQTDFAFRAALPGLRAPFDSGPVVPPSDEDVSPQDNTFFALRVMDEQGRLLDGVTLELLAGSGKHQLVTAEGLARVDDVPDGSATVALGDPDGERKRLRQSGIGLAGTPVPPGPTVLELPASVDADPAPIVSGSEHTLIITVPPKQVAALEVEDGMFRLDSAVVLPEAETPSDSEHEALTATGVFAAALAFAAANASKRALVAGHTDTSGTESHNQPLSEERAACVRVCLEGNADPANRDRFSALCDARHKIADEKQILSWAATQFGFDSGPGSIDDNAATAVEPTKRFQQAYNDNRGALGVPDADELEVDGTFGPLTWKAVFDCYEAALAEEVSTSDAIDAQLADLAELRQKLAFIDVTHKDQGFGEHFPIDEVGRDDFRSQANRRAEILFFDHGDEPDLSLPPEESEIYLPGNYERAVIDPEDSAEFLELRVCDRAGDPIPGSRVTVSVAQQQQTKIARPDGRVRFFLPAGKSTAFVEWTDPDGANGPERFTQELALDFDADTDADAAADATSPRLANLGYTADTLALQVSAFRVDFARPEDTPDLALLAEAGAWHDGGDRPERGEPLAANQTFPEGSDAEFADSESAP